MMSSNKAEEFKKTRKKVIEKGILYIDYLANETNTEADTDEQPTRTTTVTPPVTREPVTTKKETPTIKKEPADKKEKRPSPPQSKTKPQTILDEIYTQFSEQDKPTDITIMAQELESRLKDQGHTPQDLSNGLPLQTFLRNTIYNRAEQQNKIAREPAELINQDNLEELSGIQLNALDRRRILGILRPFDVQNNYPLEKGFIQGNIEGLFSLEEDTYTQNIKAAAKEILIDTILSKRNDASQTTSPQNKTLTFCGFEVQGFKTYLSLAKALGEKATLNARVSIFDLRISNILSSIKNAYERELENIEFVYDTIYKSTAPLDICSLHCDKYDIAKKDNNLFDILANKLHEQSLVIMPTKNHPSLSEDYQSGIKKFEQKLYDRGLTLKETTIDETCSIILLS